MIIIASILSFLAGLLLGTVIGVIYTINKIHEIYEDSL
jgi:uncharacterized membrane protein YdjX (TVP38/TMEM64 family)